MSALPHDPETLPTVTGRLRIAAETSSSKNQKGKWATSGHIDHNRAAADLRFYITDSLVVGPQQASHLLAGVDRAEMLDASYELPCGHLPIEACACKPVLRRPK